MDPSSDAELVQAARAGNLEVFGELVRRHQRAAVALAYSLLGDAAEAAGYPATGRLMPRIFSWH